MFSQEAKDAARACLDTDGCVDAISLAAQIGRLDLVSLLLAILGVIMALGGVLAFANFRSIARKQAGEEAQKIAKDTAERAVNDYIQSEIPNLIEEYRNFVGYTLDDSDQADQIAGAQEDGAEK